MVGNYRCVCPKKHCVHHAVGDENAKKPTWQRMDNSRYLLFRTQHCSHFVASFSCMFRQMDTVVVQRILCLHLYKNVEKALLYFTSTSAITGHLIYCLTCPWIDRLYFSIFHVRPTLYVKFCQTNGQYENNWLLQQRGPSLMSIRC